MRYACAVIEGAFLYAILTADRRTRQQLRILLEPCMLMMWPGSADCSEDFDILAGCMPNVDV